MSSQQEKNITKVKSAGRRILDGLFGNRNAHQQQTKEEELQQLLQEYSRIADERADKLAYISSISQQAVAIVSRLLETLKTATSQDEQADTQNLCETMTDDMEQLSTLIQQLNTDETADFCRKDENRNTIGLTPSARKTPVILLATDDEERGRHLKAVLDKDYEVHKCRNGWQALAEVYRSGADLIIAKTSMEIVNGLTMCRRLRSNPQTSLIPVILLADNNEQHLQALQNGADVCMVSSTEDDVIKYSVNNLLNVRRQMQLNYEQHHRTKQHEGPTQKKKSANEKLMERVMTTIYTHLKDSSLSVDMIAEEVGMSRVHLHRKMKEIIGQSPHDFIRQLRLEQATRLLATGEMNISEVAYTCGFSNAASFSTTFKNSYGLTPSEYMEQKLKQ